jgi:hypothetical protein
MLTLPVRRDPAPLAVRLPVARPRPGAGHASGPSPSPPPPAGDAVPDADQQALAQQQRAFDQLMLLRAEQQREANVIRDMMTEQLKRDEEVLKKFIEMI